MGNLLLLTTIFSLFVTSALAQSSVKLLSQDDTHTKVKVTNGYYDLVDVTTPQGASFIVKQEGSTPILEKGAPDLPKVTTSLIIPNDGSMKIGKVTHSGYTDYQQVYIAPSKGNFTRDISPSDVPYTYGDAYNTDAFWPGKLVDTRDPYILRDMRGQTVIVYPFQYNPMTNALRVYHGITVSLEPTNQAGVNTKATTLQNERSDFEYNRIYQHHFLNYSVNELKYTPVEEHGKMLIISHPDFINGLAPFVDWKKRCGIPVEVVDVTTIGNSADIKNFVANYYHQNGLTYLLLVGDHQYVPASSTSSGDSDNNYAYIEGNDAYPEIFVGRFSVENLTHLNTMIDRVLRYEKYPIAGGKWYKTGIGIASNEGPGDDGEMDFEHSRNIRTDLLAFTYDTVYELYDGSQGGWDKPGNPPASEFFNLLQNGLGVINYTGHGSSQSCGTTGLNNGDVDNLTNVDMYPFFFSVACVNGEFTNGTCFAEKWLRATDDNTGEPTGAIATLMSTINQSWSPPMCGQDEMNDILAEVNQNNIKRSFGAISMNGCMKMNDEYGSAGDQMTDTWTLFGDPSVMVRTAPPAEMNVDHATIVSTGVGQITVDCDLEDAIISLMNDGEIIGTGFASGGSVTIDIDPIYVQDTIEVTVTGFNMFPYFGDILVSPATSLLTIDDEGLAIYPNPVVDELNIVLDVDGSENINITLFDVTGAVVMQNTLIADKGTNRTSLDVNAIAVGVYYLRLDSENRSYTQKVVIEK